MQPQLPAPADSPLAFICYRKVDEPWAAMHLRDGLAAHFGSHAIFIDGANIAPGEDFRPSLLRAVARSSALLVVIGRRWSSATRDGRRLLDDEDDWVRKEIEQALLTDVPIIPVLVDDAEQPSAAELPKKIEDLAYRHHVRLRQLDFDRDLQSIIRRLENIRR